MSTASGLEQRVLVLAPRGRDADVIAGVVSREGAACERFERLDLLFSEIEQGAAAAIISEEALTDDACALASRMLKAQPAWSDFPFVVLLGKRAGALSAPLKRALTALGNVVLLERPLSAETLASAAVAAMRARFRQYQAREVLAQREEVAAELATLNANLERRVDERTIALAKANDRLSAEILERERAQNAAMQAQKLEALGRLTGGVAHDFNNVLSVIMGNVELIAMFSREDSVKARAKTAQAACKQGAKLTSQLLTFARNQSLNLKSVSIAELFANVADLVAPAVGPKVELAFEIGEGVSNAWGDISHLEMSMLNLAINARDAMAGYGRLLFKASIAKPTSPRLADGEYVRIEVADNGSGMTPEVAAKVFEPFFTTKGVGKGTGLGLSQVYGMAEQSGGAAFARSRVGEGSVIEIWLRVAPELASEASAPRASFESLAGLKVLVVEDNDQVRAGIVDALLALGCEVSQSDGGAGGIAAMALSKPQLLLTDYLMPDMTGVELAVRARAMFPGLPVLVATGYADMEDIEDAIGAGAVLRKPFQMSELGAAVSRAVAGSARPTKNAL